MSYQYSQVKNKLPVGIQIISVLYIILGLFTIAIAVLMMFPALIMLASSGFEGFLALFTFGLSLVFIIIFLIIFSFIAFVVRSSFVKRKKWARIAVMIISLLALLGNGLNIFVSDPMSSYFLGNLTAAIVNILILDYLFFNKKAKDFFDIISFDSQYEATNFSVKTKVRLIIYLIFLILLIGAGMINRYYDTKNNSFSSTDEGVRQVFSDALNKNNEKNKVINKESSKEANQETDTKTDEEINKDTDKDGVTDLVEKEIGTNINEKDTDDDGFDDNDEIKNGYNPLGSGKWDGSCAGGSWKTYYNLNDALKNSETVCSLDLGWGTYIKPIKNLYEIGQLKHLQYLVLSGAYVKTLPAEIKELKQLKILVLDHNQINTLPKEFSQLISLTDLDLTKNVLEKFPIEITKNLKLVNLNLSFDSLIELPSEIGNLVNLNSFNLTANGLNKIPQEIGNLKNLKILNLEVNDLKTIPKEIGQLSELRILNLSGNQLVILPKEINQLKNLEELYLESNNFKILSDVLVSLPKLKKLGLYDSGISFEEYQKIQKKFPKVEIKYKDYY